MLRCITVPRGVSTLHTDASGTAPPDAFGPFRVLHQIGAGALGPVFRAYQPDPGRLVAVKQFRLDLPPEHAHRFVAALDRLIAADLTHMGIAAPLAAGLTDNLPFLALDFVAAESFDVVIRDYGPAPVAEALRIATQLGGALDFAAAVNVFHGALHPRDVLVSPDDTRVTGLGISQALEEVGVTAPVRSPYTAPERIAGEPCDRRSDTFSLAALVFEMLFGHQIAGVGTEAAEAITGFDNVDLASLRVLFAKALAEDPAERYETALAFAEALQTLLSQPASLPKARGRRSRDTNGGSAARQGRNQRLVLPLDSDDDDLPLTLAEPSVPALELDTRSRPPEPVDDVAYNHIVLAAAELEPEPVQREHDETGHVEVMPSELPAFKPSTGGILGLNDYAMVPPRSTAEPEQVAEPERLPEPVTEAEPEPALGKVNGTEPSVDLPNADFDDVELRAAEAERYSIAESMSALPETVATPVEETAEEPPHVPARSLGVAVPDVAVAADAGQEVVVAPPLSISSAALEQGRSAVWPIVLALAVGLLVGFAGGYGFGVREYAGTSTSVADKAALRNEVSSQGSAAQERAAGASAPAVSASSSAAAPDTTNDQRPTTNDQRPTTNDQRPTPPARPDADTGRLIVRSAPSGARVVLDGRDVGQTPLTLNSVAAGAHVIRITHQGYLAAERRVRIRSTQTAQPIEVELVASRASRETATPQRAPQPTSGSMVFDSRPTGARVLVDGKLIGTTPMLLDEVAAGDHAVRFELDNFNPWSTTARVTGGERTKVSGSLEQR